MPRCVSDTVNETLSGPGRTLTRDPHFTEEKLK